MKFQGPVFPSFADQQTPAPRMQWTSHTGTRRRLKNLAYKCRHITSSGDSEILGLLARVRVATMLEPLPEFGRLHLICAAVDAADQTGETWATAMSYFLDKFDAIASDTP